MARNQSLDALRGLAISGMVLAGSIAFGILPRWMYHAQEPPPSHVFDPSLPGITWVDLVFPFFLFSMGAAIPLAMHKWLQAARPGLAVTKVALRRFGLLAGFAIFIAHVGARAKDLPAVVYWSLPPIAFVLLFFFLWQPSAGVEEKRLRWGRGIAGLCMLALLYWLPLNGGEHFSLYRSDIIILLLANMAFMGTLVWWLTAKRPALRMALLFPLFALLLTATLAGSWNQQLADWSPLPWLYRFDYLKYLLIVLPGTLAGDWILADRGETDATHGAPAWLRTGLPAIALVLSNLVLLYRRETTLNLLLNILLCSLIWWQRKKVTRAWERRSIEAAVFFLLSGLCLEALQGGIKKDPATFSYLFISCALAFLTLLILYYCQFSTVTGWLASSLARVGRNPMIAYVAGSLLVLPVLHATGGMQVFHYLERSVAGGFVRGVLFTAAVLLITNLCTRKGWYWRA